MKNDQSFMCMKPSETLASGHLQCDKFVNNLSFQG